MLDSTLFTYKNDNFIWLNLTPKEAVKGCKTEWRSCSWFTAAFFTVAMETTKVSTAR
jgi:hypothetical protein